MSRIRRIVFTADILRPHRGPCGWGSATHKNARWLGHLLGWPLSRATGLETERVSFEPGGFDPRLFYDAMGLRLDAISWASVIHLTELPDAAREALARPFDGALVIGVEIPDVMQRVLAEGGIPFVDVVSHPVRFMDDLLFALRTNHPGIHAAPTQHAFDVDRCTPFADLHRAKAAWMPPLDLPPATALITGQVATDKAVICPSRRRFVSLADYVEPLFDLCARHERVLFKPHPYQGADCPSRAVIQSMRAIQTVEHNFYYLMGQEQITDVYAINSGTVHEAPYFGKRGHGFLAPLYEFGARAPVAGGAGACVPVTDAILSPAFWSDVLVPCVPTRADVPAGPPPRPSRLRRSLNADWDHGYIDAIVQRATPAPVPAGFAEARTS